MKFIKQVVITVRAILGWPFILVGFLFFIVGEFLTGRIVTYRANDVKNELLAAWEGEERVKQILFNRSRRGNGFRKASKKRK